MRQIENPRESDDLWKQLIGQNEQPEVHIDKEPIPEDVRRAIDLRMKCKRGEHIRSADLQFLEKLLRDYPEWYASTDLIVFDSTKPFGSEGL